MNIVIAPGKAVGTIAAPPSKSMAHRLLIAAGLARGKSSVHGLAYSGDILATIDCLRAMGATVETHGDTAQIIGADPACAPDGTLFACKESGSTLRFFIPLCLLSRNSRILTGSTRLMQRPQTVYEAICRRQHLLFERQEDRITVQGPLTGGDYSVAGDISSQFITGLLFALPLTASGGTITITGRLESRPYLDLTLEALRAFGVNAARVNEATLSVSKGNYQPAQVTVEGDYSNAAFLEALTLLGGDVTVTGLNESSLQGDRVYRQMFAALNGGTPTLSLADCPDLGPILMALAAALHGAVFTDTARLAIKESNRGRAMAAELAKFGVPVVLQENRIVVPGGRLTAPNAVLDGHNDHRIVMALATICTRTGGAIAGAQAVNKSFPDYFDRLTQLGISWKEDPHAIESK